MISVTQQSPNLVVFFADNTGWGDIFGAPSTHTPTLDSLARDGMRLLNWYSAAHVCSPSRASLLTGRLMVRTGVYPMTFHNDAASGLPANETTIAEHLRKVGYATFAVGKWCVLVKTAVSALVDIACYVHIGTLDNARSFSLLKGGLTAILVYLTVWTWAALSQTAVAGL